MKELFKIISILVPIVGLFGGLAGADKKFRDDIEERREHEEHKKEARGLVCLVIGVLLSCGLILLVKKHEDDKKRLGFRI